MLPLLFIKFGLAIIVGLFAIIPDPPNFRELVEAREDIQAAWEIVISIPYVFLGPLWLTIAYMLSFILAIKVIFLPVRIVKRIIFGKGA